MDQTQEDKGDLPEESTGVSDQKEVKEESITLPKIAEGSVEGQVSCVEGPMLNATVSVGMNSTLSDSKGNFLIEHIPPGIVKIRVKSPTSRFYDLSQDILVEADQKKQNLFLFLSEVTGIVEGKVTDESGKPLVGAEVSGLFRLGKDVMIAKSDENGHFIFTEIPRGSYYVRAKAQGFMTEGLSINVIGGSTSLTNFTLKPGSLMISGRVTDKAGKPIDCEIFLLRKGIVVTRANTSGSSDGTFSFNDLVPDIYEMGTSSPGHMPKGWFGKLEKSEVVNFELEDMVVQEEQPR